MKEAIDFFKNNYAIRDGLIVGELFRIDDRQRTRIWRVIIELLLGNEHVPITEDMIRSGQSVPGHVCKYWTETGFSGKDLRKYMAKYVTSGKNIGKVNETTILGQCIRDTIKLFQHKSQKDFNKTLAGVATLDNMFEQGRWRISPPAFHRIDDNWHMVTYPCFIQPKIDGERLLCVYHPDIHSYELYPGLGVFTRSRKDYTGDQPEILADVYRILKDHPGVYIDGEIGIRGESFQTISGYARRKKNAVKLFYYVFDLFDSHNPSQKYGDRRVSLSRLLKHLGDSPVIFLETYSVHDRTQLQAKMDEFIAMNDEGSVVRLRHSAYKYSFGSEKRIKGVLKWKLVHDAEWVCTSFIASTGEHEGAIMWVCVTKGGQEFTIGFYRGIFTVPERIILYKYLSENPDYFNEHLRGQLLMIKYQALTESNIPIRGGAFRFREPEVQAKIIDIIDASR